jgi:hypothetical protein
MPSTFEILSVGDTPRRWNSKTGKPWISYPVEFKGEQGQGKAELSRPEGKPAPTVGEKVEADLDNSNPSFPAKLVEVFKGGGGGKSFGKSFGKSPQERKSIVRQHSQEMALMHCSLLQKQGKLAENYGVDALKAIVDWFTADVEAHAGQA